MEIEGDVKELKRLCMLLFLELQDIRHHLDISPIGLLDNEEYQKSVGGYLKQFDDKLRSLKRDLPNID